MKRESSRNDKSGRPHSERAGEAVLSSGGQAVTYRALRDLTCSRCGEVIREGDLFTREVEPSSGLPLIRRCRACVLFPTGGRLLDALLAPEGEGEVTPAGTHAEVREKVLSRLGPALAACRSRRGNTAG